MPKFGSVSLRINSKQFNAETLTDGAVGGASSSRWDGLHVKILTARKKTKNAYRRIDDEDDDLGLIIRFDRLSWLV
jgi:hypothetical protein